MRSRMASPFPGMDPYLEGDDWTSFHTHLATEVARQLTPLLRPKYVALPEKRFEIGEQGTLASESIYPDVEAPYLLETVMEERAPHTWVEIRDTAQRRLVTTVE